MWPHDLGLAVAANEGVPDLIAPGGLIFLHNDEQRAVPPCHAVRLLVPEDQVLEVLLLVPPIFVWIGQQSVVELATLVGVGAYVDDAARGGQGLGLAVQLVAEALDVVHPVGNDNVVARQHALDGRVLLGAGILLGPCCVVDGARHAQGLVVDEVHFQAAGARIAAAIAIGGGGGGGGIGDLSFAVLLELEGACRLPRGWIA